jgi:hypothetical protein
MRRFDLLLTLVVVGIGLMLIASAGQPVTPEAELVGRWYTALCAQQADFETLEALTWHGGLSDEAFREAIIRYRDSGQIAIPCEPVIDHDLIFFQWIPLELGTTVERIKFAAVNVYATDAGHEPNHILSVRAGVQIVFFKSGDAKIIAGFLGIPLMDSAASGELVTLFNNDGLTMGTARVTDAAMIASSGDMTFVGVSVELNPSRTWGSYTIRLFSDDVQVEGVKAADDLPEAYREGFIPAYGEGIEAGKTVEGVVWFRTNSASNAVRVSFEANQTPWDMRPLSAFADAAVTP